MKKILTISYCLLLCGCMGKSAKKETANSLRKDTDSVQKIISAEEAVQLAMKKFDAYLPTILSENPDTGIDLQIPNVGDFTGDGVEDVAIYFNLVPKDGGNAIISQGLSLYQNTGENLKIIAGYEPDYLFAFDTIRDGKIHVVKLEYAETDGHCCPSIKTPHILTIKANVAY
ncbi:hypothetical protein [Paenimyroides aestuarii]|uniref:Lipoprotein n=1 Tax=Paenimyroides aestuarii TaxID=2968490 RepID=A0ABY5NT40_9FLAO|nr:hypothetical protein [Paenimyroides aestuarii]UUV21745.1 hypothetical protein NPX36_01450 [Paenimyroides aestuarii]